MPLISYVINFHFIGKIYSRNVYSVLLLHKNLPSELRFRTSKHFTEASKSGAITIIGDGDFKRVPFLVLGLSIWHGTIFLFWGKIAPSPAAHACTCCEDFCGCQRKWHRKFLESFMLSAHHSTCLCLLEFGLSIFVVTCSSLSEVRQCRI